MINKKKLGRAGLDVSRIALGAMNFGWRTDEAASFAILDAYLATGGNFLETASISPPLTLPTAATAMGEKILGRWLVSRGIRRSDLVIGTRINVRVAPAGDASVEQLVGDSVRESMRRMNVDYLDLLVIEWSDGVLPMERTFEALDAVVRPGLARHVGAANFPAWRVVDGNARASERGWPQVEVLQCDYSIMQRARFELEAMSLCEERGLGLIASSPLAGGFLARRRSGVFGPASRQWLYRRFNNDYGDAALAAVGSVASRYDASPAQVAISWMLANEAVTSAMVGVRSVEELHELVQACELRLQSEDVLEISEATLAEEVLMRGGAPWAVVA